MRSNKNAAIFLDRDGTIIEDGGHLKEPSDVIFFAETFEALRKLQDYFSLFIVTNQTGVAEGKITLRDVRRVNRSIVCALFERGIKIQDVYTCPHWRLDNCHCIKPKPYFLKKAANLYGLNLNRSFTIGDHPHDIQLAENAGAQGVYVLTGHGRKHLAEIPHDTEVATGIIDAAEKIISTCRVETSRQKYKTKEKGFTLNLGVACELWWRDDLGLKPKYAKEVAGALHQAGIRVHKISSGWLECEPRPVGIWEALTGRLVSPDWAKQFDCPPEQSGRVLKLLAERGILVQPLE